MCFFVHFTATAENVLTRNIHRTPDGSFCSFAGSNNMIFESVVQDYNEHKIYLMSDFNLHLFNMPSDRRELEHYSSSVSSAYFLTSLVI